MSEDQTLSTKDQIRLMREGKQHQKDAESQETQGRYAESQRHADLVRDERRYLAHEDTRIALLHTLGWLLVLTSIVQSIAISGVFALLTLNAALLCFIIAILIRNRGTHRAGADRIVRQLESFKRN